MRKLYVALGVSVFALLLVPVIAFAANYISYIGFDLKSGQSSTTTVTTASTAQSYQVNWETVTKDSGVTSGYYFTVKVVRPGLISLFDETISDLDMYNPVSGSVYTHSLGNHAVGDYKYTLSTYKAYMKGIVYVN